MKLRLLSVMAIIYAFVGCSHVVDDPRADMYVGTFTRTGGLGIHTMQFDTETGEITSLEMALPLRDPSFLALSSDKSVLYAFNNVTVDSAEVLAYRVDPETRNLTEISNIKTPTKTFCYVALFDDGRYVGFPSYNEGTSYCFPVNADGTIANEPSVVQHEGSSIHPTRQTQTHAHSIIQDPQQGSIYIPDLGTDRIVIYSLTEGRLDSIGYAGAIPGDGPRHLAFHHNGKYIASVNELSNTVTVFRRDDNGLFTVPIQHISTLPEGYDEESTAADIHFSKDGTALYASNRGHNSVAVYRFDPDTGSLESKGWITEQIDYPRNFAIDPTGRFMLVANQLGNSIVVYRIGEDPTQLFFTGHSVEIAEPVSIVF